MSQTSNDSAATLAEAIADALRETASRLMLEKTGSEGRARPELDPETVLRFLTFFGGRDA